MPARKKPASKSGASRAKRSQLQAQAGGLAFLPLLGQVAKSVAPVLGQLLSSFGGSGQRMALKGRGRPARLAHK